MPSATLYTGERLAMLEKARLGMNDVMKAEIMADKAHYEQALRRIMWKNEETNGTFCNGYFAKVAKNLHLHLAIFANM